MIDKKSKTIELSKKATLYLESMMANLAESDGPIKQERERLKGLLNEAISEMKTEDAINIMRELSELDDPKLSSYRKTFLKEGRAWVKSNGFTGEMLRNFGLPSEVIDYITDDSQPNYRLENKELEAKILQVSKAFTVSDIAEMFPELTGHRARNIVTRLYKRGRLKRAVRPPKVGDNLSRRPHIYRVVQYNTNDDV